MWTNSNEQWGKLSQWFHWSMALLIFGMLGVGLYMVSLPPTNTKWMFYGLHKSFGVIVLILAIVRLLWRTTQPIPHLSHIPSWQRIGARTVHRLLYLFMLMMPVSGYIMSVAGGHPIQVFNLWTVPALFEPNKALASFANDVHRITSRLFIAALILHMSAAFYHHWIRKDFVLNRMLGRV
jgi:cytochrome b561